MKKAEAHLYTVIKVAREEDISEQIGRDIYFDLVDRDKVHSFHIQKQISFKSFKEEVAKEFGIPVQFQRFWLFSRRLNHTFRPHRPLSTPEETHSVGQLLEVSNKAHNAKLWLFLEVELGDSGPVLPPDRTEEDILLFFKLFDPVKEELTYMGRFFVRALGKPTEILWKLNEMAGFSPNENLELYEEIKFDPTVMCEHINMGLSFKSNELQDGDIICYQKRRPGNAVQCCYPDIPSFLQYVHNRQVVPSATKIRSAGMIPELEEKLNIMSNQVVVTGEDLGAPSIGSLPPDMEHIEAEENNLEDGLEVQRCDLEEMDRNASTTIGNASASSIKRRIGKEKRVATPYMGELRESTLAVPVKHLPVATIKETVELISSIPEIRADLNLYYFAVNYMRDKNSREIFTSIPDDIRVWWIKNAYVNRR